MKLNTKKTICVGFAFLLICMFWQVYDNVIAKILIDSFGLNQTWSGVVMALDNVLAIFLLPLFGKLSDDTHTKWGKRTPYIVIGTVLAAALIVIIGLIDKVQINHLAAAGIEEIKTVTATSDMTLANGSVILKGDNYYVYKEIIYATKELASSVRTEEVAAIRSENIFVFIAFIGVLLLVLVAMAAFRTPAVSLMPDVTVKPLRSKANAIINLMGTAGGIIALGFMSFLVTEYQSYIQVFIVLAVLMIICLVVFLLTVNEKKLVEKMHQDAIAFGIEEKDEEMKELQTKEDMPKEVRKSFFLILISIVFWFMAYNAATSKFSVYASEVLDTGYTLPLMVAQAAAVISYIPIGILSSKFGRKKMILTGVVILFAAFFGGAFVTAKSAILVWVVMALAGIGWATINVNSYPMVVEMSKGSNIGKYTGIYYTASMAAQIVTPILSGILMDATSMRILFPYSAVFCVLAFITMFFVKHGDSKPLPTKTIEAFDTPDD